MLRDALRHGELTMLAKYRKNQLVKHDLHDLFWECTMTCNAKCKHCGSNAENRQYAGELTTGEAKSAFAQIAQDMNSGKIFVMVTGGEPLTRKDLCEVMSYATSLGFHWGLVTNGMLLTDENIKGLQNAGLKTISISIDGIGKTHDEFRGVDGSYEKIIENIKKLGNAKFLKHLQVTTIFHKRNISELERLYEVMSGLRLSSWRIGIADPIGRVKENLGILLDGKDIKHILDFIKKKNKHGKLQITYSCPGFLGLEYEKDARGYYFNCRTGINVASILYNGDLFVCPNVPKRPELIQGNIRVDNFAEVWQNKYKEFRSGDRTTCEYCNKCEHWEYCLGGAYHTWNFEKNLQESCPYDMIKKELKNV